MGSSKESGSEPAAECWVGRSREEELHRGLGWEQYAKVEGSCVAAA